MTFDLQRVLERKRVYRERLASRPIAEKLRVLDALREREIAIRGTVSRRRAGKVGENATSYSSKE